MSAMLWSGRPALMIVRNAHNHRCRVKKHKSNQTKNQWLRKMEFAGRIAHTSISTLLLAGVMYSGWSFNRKCEQITDLPRSTWNATCSAIISVKDFASGCVDPIKTLAESQYTGWKKSANQWLESAVAACKNGKDK